MYPLLVVVFGLRALGCLEFQGFRVLRSDQMVQLPRQSAIGKACGIDSIINVSMMMMMMISIINIYIEVEFTYFVGL